MSGVLLHIPRTPPSMNTNKIRSHWRGFHTAKKEWQRELEQLFMAVGVPRPIRSEGPVEASVTLRFPMRRRRDSENFRPLLSKALGDALVNGGWLTDDTDQDWWLRLSISQEIGSPQTTVELLWDEPEAMAA